MKAVNWFLFILFLVLMCILAMGFDQWEELQQLRQQNYETYLEAQALWEKVMEYRQRNIAQAKRLQEALSRIEELENPSANVRVLIREIPAKYY